jgi:hypothetical protein
VSMSRFVVAPATLAMTGRHDCLPIEHRGR